jgi:hypothetical protein
MGSHIQVATSYLHWQDDGGCCSRIILVSNDFFFIGERPYIPLWLPVGARWGGVFMALNSSMPWMLVGLVHSFPCTRSFFKLSCCIKFGCVQSRRGFCCVRYCRGRNLFPLSKKIYHVFRNL